MWQSSIRRPSQTHPQNDSCAVEKTCNVPHDWSERNLPITSCRVIHHPETVLSFVGTGQIPIECDLRRKRTVCATTLVECRSSALQALLADRTRGGSLWSRVIREDLVALWQAKVAALAREMWGQIVLKRERSRPFSGGRTDSMQRS